MKFNNLSSSHLLLSLLALPLEPATASNNDHLLRRQQPSTSSSIPVSSSTAAAATAASTPSTLIASMVPNLPTNLPTPSSSPSSTSLSPSSSSRPRNHNIAVGLNGTTFTPTTLKNIPISDTLTFYFYPTNYSVIQSSFETPCEPIGTSGSSAGSPGLFSGWFPTTPGNPGIARQKFMVNVTSAETMWIYALDGMALAGHEAVANGSIRNVCTSGMAMVVNPILPKERADGKTLSAYRRVAAAIDVGSMGKEGVWKVPGQVSGGEVRGVSEKEKVRWEGKHPDPDGDNDVGGGAGAEGGNGTGSVDGYRSEAVTRSPLGLGSRMVLIGMGLAMAFELV